MLSNHYLLVFLGLLALRQVSGAIKIPSLENNTVEAGEPVEVLTNINPRPGGEETPCERLTRSFQKAVQEVLEEILQQQRSVASSMKSIASSMKSLTSLLAPNALSSVGSCPPPWERFGSMCLLKVCKHMTWQKALENCFQNGGDLVWMTDASQHHVISLFDKRYEGGCFEGWFYWTGLHRNSAGNLVWTRREAGSYRGTEIDSEKEKYFASGDHSQPKKFIGKTVSDTRPSICRRV